MEASLYLNPVLQQQASLLMVTIVRPELGFEQGGPKYRGCLVSKSILVVLERHLQPPLQGTSDLIESHGFGLYFFLYVTGRGKWDKSVSLVNVLYTLSDSYGLGNFIPSYFQHMLDSKSNVSHKLLPYTLSLISPYSFINTAEYFFKLRYN